MKISLQNNYRRLLSQSYTIFLIMITLLFISGCSQSDDQRKFENEALSPPNNFTQTNAQGEIISEDPDDWRIAPFFQGLVEINPAYPNPVQTTDRVNIDFTVTGIESVMGLFVAVRFDDGTIRRVYENDIAPMPPGLTLIQINPIELGRFNNVQSALGLHRVILFDRNENIISYGDIMVQ